MTPPDHARTSNDAGTQADPAASSCLQVLQKRSDFLAAAKARRAPVAGFLLQARQRNEAEPAEGVRVGFTCSKKLGNAVTRNRAKRRLRALAREALLPHAQDGWDYVLVGKPRATVTREYSDLLADMAQAIAKIHKPR
ncbi:ribonuclease P protein component [Pararhodobacter oceanensis]|uniref:ribonuclease P protein component n=1 Tax=Pararhodobacter oceanensis TaxID=2172121 RepID=UPI003A912DF2